MRKYLNLRQIICLGLTVAFLVNTLGPLPAYAQDYVLPAPGVMVQLSPEFNPPILKGIKVHPDNPFRFDFILDKGDNQLTNDALKDESSKLIKYFLASLTIPEKDLWVNLSPYEKDRIIPNSFGLTEMGRDLLAEDYMLKQITASLIYPEGETGKKFWKHIYEEAEKKFGTTNVPVNTFNKVWIVPEKAVVYENAKAGTAYVVESKLKVMLEQDYLSLQEHTAFSPSLVKEGDRGSSKDTSTFGSQIVREIVIPELTKEVNENKNFAQLRQVYNSLILATWYKKKIKDSILEQVYANKNKVAGVNIDDPKEKERIYQRYLKAFKKGVYNYIKESVDPVTQQDVPRKYFSGGMGFSDYAMNSALGIYAMPGRFSPSESDLAQVTVNLDRAMEGEKKDQAMTRQEKIDYDMQAWTNLNLQKYLDDIHQAEAEEQITYTPKQRENPIVDEFSHLGNGWITSKIWDVNTRSFDIGAKNILLAIRKQAGDRRLRGLELGPGAGLALGKMYLISGNNMDLDTVSLTPLAPHIILRMDSSIILNLIARYLGEGKHLGIPDFDQYMDEKLYFGDHHYPLSQRFISMNDGQKKDAVEWLSKRFPGMPLSLVFELQQHGINIFEEAPEPYIHHQYIGDFSDKDIILPGNYDFIYDLYGALYYSVMEFKVGKVDPLEKAAQALSPEGVLFLVEGFPVRNMLKAIKPLSGFTGILFYNGSIAIMREQSQVFERIKSKLKKSRDEFFYTLQKGGTEELVKAILEDKAIAETNTPPENRAMTGEKGESQTKDRAMKAPVDESFIPNPIGLGNVSGVEIWDGKIPLNEILKPSNGQQVIALFGEPDDTGTVKNMGLPGDNNPDAVFHKFFESFGQESTLSRLKIVYLGNVKFSEPDPKNHPPIRQEDWDKFGRKYYDNVSDHYDQVKTIVGSLLGINSDIKLGIIGGDDGYFYPNFYSFTGKTSTAILANHVLGRTLNPQATHIKNKANGKVIRDLRLSGANSGTASTLKLTQSHPDSQLGEGMFRLYGLDRWTQYYRSQARRLRKNGVSSKQLMPVEVIQKMSKAGQWASFIDSELQRMSEATNHLQAGVSILAVDILENPGRSAQRNGKGSLEEQSEAGNPRGISSADARAYAKAAGKAGASVFDIHDVNPGHDKNNMTVKLAASLIGEYLKGMNERLEAIHYPNGFLENSLGEKDERLAIAARSITHGGAIFDSEWVHGLSFIYGFTEHRLNGIHQATAIVQELGKYIENFSKIYEGVFREGIINPDLRGQRTYQLRFYEAIKQVIGEVQGLKRAMEQISADKQMLELMNKDNYWSDEQNYVDVVILKLMSRKELAEGSVSGQTIKMQDLVNQLKEYFPWVNYIFGSPEDDTKEIRGNLYSLTSAVFNLIRNGWVAARDKYGDNSKTKIVVSVTSENDKVLIAVSDNGPGIPEDLLQMDKNTGRMKIFNLNVTTKTEGTGLGTTEAWYAVKDMGGIITAENQVGGGAIFTIRLPIDKAMSAETPIATLDWVDTMKEAVDRYHWNMGQAWFVPRREEREKIEVYSYYSLFKSIDKNLKQMNQGEVYYIYPFAGPDVIPNMFGHTFRIDTDQGSFLKGEKRIKDLLSDVPNLNPIPGWDMNIPNRTMDAFSLSSYDSAIRETPVGKRVLILKGFSWGSNDQGKITFLLKNILSKLSKGDKVLALMPSAIIDLGKAEDFNFTSLGVSYPYFERAIWQKIQCGSLILMLPGAFALFEKTGDQAMTAPTPKIKEGDVPFRTMKLDMNSEGKLVFTHDLEPFKDLESFAKKQDLNLKMDDSPGRVLNSKLAINLILENLVQHEYSKDNRYVQEVYYRIYQIGRVARMEFWGEGKHPLPSYLIDKESSGQKYKWFDTIQRPWEGQYAPKDAIQGGGADHIGISLMFNSLSIADSYVPGKRIKVGWRNYEMGGHLIALDFPDFAMTRVGGKDRAMASQKFNLEVAIKYIEEEFRKDTKMAKLPILRKLAEDLVLSLKTFSDHYDDIVTALQQRINNGAYDKEPGLKERLIQALANKRKEMKSRKKSQKFNLKKVMRYIEKEFRKDAKMAKLPSLGKLAEDLGPNQTTFSSHYDEILTALQQKISSGAYDKEPGLKERLNQALTNKSKEIESRKELQKFNLEAVMGYIDDEFRKNSKAADLPSQLKLAEELGPHQSTFSTHYKKILTALQQKINSGFYDKEPGLKERLNQALANKRKEIENRKEPQEFNLEAVMGYIEDEFRKDANLEDLPSQNKLAEDLGLSQSSFSNHYKKILTALQQKIDSGVYDKEPGLKERLSQALINNRKEMESRAEFSLEAVIEYIDGEFRNDAKMTELPILRKLAEGLGLSQSTFSNRYDEILTALQERIDSGAYDKEPELKERLIQALINNSKEIESRKKRKLNEMILNWRKSVPISKGRINKISEELGLPSNFIQQKFEEGKIAIIGRAMTGVVKANRDSVGTDFIITVPQAGLVKKEKEVGDSSQLAEGDQAMVTAQINAAPIFKNSKERESFAGTGEIASERKHGETLALATLTSDIAFSFKPRNEITRDFLQPEKISGGLKYTLPEDITVAEAGLLIDSIRGLPVGGMQLSNVISQSIIPWTTMHPRDNFQQQFKRWLADLLGYRQGQTATLVERAVQGIQIELDILLFWRGVQLYAQELANGKIDLRILKSKINIAESKHSIASVAAAQLKAIKSVVDIIRQLPLGWGNESVIIKSSPQMGRLTNEINCVLRSALAAFYLQELDIKVWSMHIPNHQFLLAQLGDDTYWRVDPFTPDRIDVTKMQLPFSNPISAEGVIVPLGKNGENTEIYEWRRGIMALFYENTGVVLQEQGKLEEAIAVYNKAIELDPTNPTVYSSTGNALHKQGKLEEAVAVHNKAIKLDRKNAFFYYNLGNVLRTQGKLEEAVAEYDKAIELDPRHAKFFYNLGLTLQLLGKLEEAIAGYDKAIELEPWYTDAYNNKGVALKALGKLEEAIAEYDKAIKWDSKYVLAYKNKCLALKVQGKTEEANEAFAMYDKISRGDFAMTGVEGKESQKDAAMMAKESRDQKLVKARRKVELEILNGLPEGEQLSKRELWEKLKQEPGYANVKFDIILNDLKSGHRLKKPAVREKLNVRSVDREIVKGRRDQLWEILNGIEGEKLTHKELAQKLNLAGYEDVTSDTVRDDFINDQRLQQQDVKAKLHLREHKNIDKKTVKARRNQLLRILKGLNKGEQLTPKGLIHELDKVPGYKDVTEKAIRDDLVLDKRFKKPIVREKLSIQDQDRKVIKARRDKEVEILSGLKEGEQLSLKELTAELNKVSGYETVTQKTVNYDLDFDRRFQRPALQDKLNRQSKLQKDASTRRDLLLDILKGLKNGKKLTVPELTAELNKKKGYGTVKAKYIYRDIDYDERFQESAVRVRLDYMKSNKINKVILLEDSDQILLKRLRSALKIKGYSVVLAHGLKQIEDYLEMRPEIKLVVSGDSIPNDILEDRKFLNIYDFLNQNEKMDSTGRKKFLDTILHILPPFSTHNGNGKVAETAMLPKLQNGNGPIPNQVMLNNLKEEGIASTNGGIDFNSSRVDLQVQNKDGEIKFHLDPAMLQQLQNAPGFVPVIINIQPMTNLREFLGLKEQQAVSAAV